MSSAGPLRVITYHARDGVFLSVRCRRRFVFFFTLVPFRFPSFSGQTSSSSSSSAAVAVAGAASGREIIDAIIAGTASRALNRSRCSRRAERSSIRAERCSDRAHAPPSLRRAAVKRRSADDTTLASHAHLLSSTFPSVRSECIGVSLNLSLSLYLSLALPVSDEQVFRLPVTLVSIITVCAERVTRGRDRNGSCEVMSKKQSSRRAAPCGHESILSKTLPLLPPQVLLKWLWIFRDLNVTSVWLISTVYRVWIMIWVIMTNRFESEKLLRERKSVRSVISYNVRCTPYICTA